MKRGEYKMTQQVDTTDYKQKYEQALERAKKGECIENIFPELRESEDEKWRKWLIGHLKGYINQTDDKYAEVCKKAIAWLEKQDEQKLDDKVKPKFNVGDWITNGEYIWKVTDIKPLDYVLQSPNGDVVDDIISYVDEYFHLWTIQDAKDGDVLQANKCTLIFDSLTKDVDGNTVISSWYFCDSKKFYGMGTSKPDLWGIEEITPSTKEQRDLLFQKMREEGYEWDSEKKELRNIEQKPTWSEEDEKIINGICNYLMCSDSPEGYTEWIDYLKSLKERISQPHWKPSEEQLRAIINSVQGLYQCKEKEVLLDLYEQLKNL